MDFVFMLVALYFILISFFIILSTLSVKDNAKLQSAVSGISKSFKMNDRIAVTVNKVEPTSYSVFLSDLQGWIGNLYAIGNVSIVRRGSVVAVTIRHPRFFIDGTTQFSEDAKKAMQSLVALLTAWQSEYLSELEVQADEPVDGSGVQIADIGATHAGVIAAYLTEHGIMPQALAVSLRADPDPVLAFTFIIRIPPKINEEYVPAK